MRVHVKSHDKGIQELTLDSVNMMLVKGQLDGRELAWVPGMSEWPALELVPGIVRPQPPPLPSTLSPAPIRGVAPSLPVPAARDAPPNQFLPDRFDSTEIANWRRFLFAAHPQAWRRFWARLIDVGIARVCLELIGLVILLTTGLWPPYETQPIVAFVGTFAFWVVFLALYEASMLSVFGTTAGKLIFRIRVVRPDGSLLSFREALARANRAIGFGMFYLVAFPGLTVLAFYRAYKALVASGYSSWDLDTGSVVRCRRVSVLLYAFGVVLAISSLLGYMVTREYVKQDFRRTIIQKMAR